MTLKFTKIGVGVESGNEALLFEFLDHEIPSTLELEWETALATSKFANDNQTNQIIGTYLNPITWTGKLYGDYIDSEGRIVRANDRYEQLKRLDKRIIKLWFEGIKQLVVIEELKKGYYSNNEIEYTITLQPHDIQIPIKPSKKKQMLDESKFALTTTTSTSGLPKEVENNMGGEQYILTGEDPTKLTEQDKKKAKEQINKEAKALELKGNLNKTIKEAKKADLFKNIIDRKKAKIAPTDKNESSLRYYKIDGVYVGLNQNEESEYKKKLGIK